MGAKIFAAVTMLSLTVGVIANDVMLGEAIDRLIDLVEESDTYHEAEAALDFFDDKRNFIGLSVNHEDITDIEQLLCEYAAELREGDEGARITKSRLISALLHLRRLSSVNGDSII